MTTLGAGPDEWQRPWETMRDRSTYAMSFASAYAADTFVNLSEPFIQAVGSGEVGNQPAYASEATVRLDDVYHLHALLRSAHAGIAASVASVSVGQRRSFEHALGFSTILAFILLLLVHLVVVSPGTQPAAASEFSRMVYQAGGWDAGVKAGGSLQEEQMQPTIVRLQIFNASWPEEWLRPYVLWLQQASNATGAAAGALPAAQPQKNATSTNSMRSLLLARLAGWAAWCYELAFPVPLYEIAYGAKAIECLEVRSPALREAMGARLVELQVSARDHALFGPTWVRELLSFLHLYDLFVIHALPAAFAKAWRQTDSADFRLHLLVGRGWQQVLDLEPVARGAAAADSPGAERRRASAQRSLQLACYLLAGLAGAALLSAFLRRLAILSVRMHVYSAKIVEHMRRYAFIAETMRKINSYSSNELLDLWTAWAALLALMAWVLYEALTSGVLWLGALSCFVLAEYWSIAHVRTEQSRWIFPRALLPLYAGTFAYRCRWPFGPSWLLLWCLASAQLWLMYALLCRFDCYATLPEQPPHRLFLRSLLRPATMLSREPQATEAAAAYRGRTEGTPSGIAEQQEQTHCGFATMHGETPIGLAATLERARAAAALGPVLRRRAPVLLSEAETTWNP